MNALSRPLSRPIAYLARIDKVTLAILLLLAVLGVADAIQLRLTMEFAAAAVLKTFPFLLASVGLAAYAKASGADNLIARAFTGTSWVAILGAALMGALSPFCSCGVIPVVAALLSMGVPLGPVMAFWIASPLMDPSMFLLTTATLGFEFAMAKTIAAIAIGIFSGFAALLLVRAGTITEVLRENVGNGGCATSRIRNPKAVVWTFWREQARREVMLRTSLSTGLLLAKWLVLAFILESLMVAWMPSTFASGLIRHDGITTVLAATAVGIPSYLNGYAALPLVRGLIEQGLAPGAAMAFLIAGGVTSIPAAMAVWAVTRRRVFALYVMLGIFGSITAGIAYEYWTRGVA